MPFKEHRDFIPPDNPNSKIWRYMNLAKFISVLEYRSLYFPRVDRLIEKDQYEGHYNSPNLLLTDKKYADLPEEWKGTSIKNELEWELMRIGFKTGIEQAAYEREVTFVNSWHIKEYESDAMWKIYLSNDEGIVIQSTYQRLVDSLKDYNEFLVFIGKIKYIDYEKDRIPFGNGLKPFMHKRNHFGHEEELRALIWTPQDGKNDTKDPSKNKYKGIFGLNVPVILDTLIEKVYIAPKAPSWNADLIRAILKRYDLDVELHHSKLSTIPPQ